VLSDDQKAQIAEQFTETIASVAGEPVRGLTWVVIDDMTSGQLTIGGRPITTDRVREVLAGGTSRRQRLTGSAAGIRNVAELHSETTGAGAPEGSRFRCR